jgi:hypothetical protein
MVVAMIRLERVYYDAEKGVEAGATVGETFRAPTIRDSLPVSPVQRYDHGAP